MMQLIFGTGGRAALLLAATLPAGAAAAATPVAIVEDVAAAAADVQFLDYLPQGRRIALGADGRIVLGYLNSCLREEIARGTVVVGAEQSAVSGGTVKRTRVECDGGKLLLSSRESDKAGAVVVRRVAPARAPAVRGGAAPTRARPPVQAAMTVYSLTPLFKLGARAASVTVRRLDRDAPALTLRLSGGIARIDKTADALARDGLYRARAGKRSIVFRVDRNARTGGPLLSRLIDF